MRDRHDDRIIRTKRVCKVVLSVQICNFEATRAEKRAQMIKRVRPNNKLLFRSRNCEKTLLGGGGSGTWPKERVISSDLFVHGSRPTASVRSDLHMLTVVGASGCPSAQTKGSEVTADQSFNRGSVVSRQFELRTVIQYHGIFAFVLRPKFLYPFGIHQGRALNSHKSR
jgi:hypothetical protein